MHKTPKKHIPGYKWMTNAHKSDGDSRVFFADVYRFAADYSKSTKHPIDLLLEDCATIADGTSLDTHYAVYCKNEHLDLYDAIFHKPINEHKYHNVRCFNGNEAIVERIIRQAFKRIRKPLKLKPLTPLQKRAIRLATKKNRSK
jgi:hypothetical protein